MIPTDACSQGGILPHETSTKRLLPKKENNNEQRFKGDSRDSQGHGTPLMVSSFPYYSHTIPISCWSNLTERSYMQILLKLFEQLLAPIVNGQPGEAEVAADLVALLGAAGNLGWCSWGDQQKKPKKLAPGSWKWWALVQMIFRNSTFQWMFRKRGYPMVWNHVIFEVIIFWAK